MRIIHKRCVNRVSQSMPRAPCLKYNAPLVRLTKLPGNQKGNGVGNQHNQRSNSLEMTVNIYHEDTKMCDSERENATLTVTDALAP